MRRLANKVISVVGGSGVACGTGGIGEVFMLTIGITDSGTGGLTVLKKLYRTFPARYIYLADTLNAPYSLKKEEELKYIAEQSVVTLCGYKADGIVFASNALTAAAFSYVSSVSETVVFGCEPPVAHACQYTASNVLAVGSETVLASLKKNNSANVIYRSLPLLEDMAENGASCSETASYIESATSDLEGRFDCIVLCSTSYGLCKDCFLRVFPRVKIFDSADGAVQRLRRYFGKQERNECELRFVFTSDKEENTEKYTKITQEILKSY